MDYLNFVYNLWMLYIVFYLNLRLKYVVKYLFLFFYKYLRVPVDIKKLCRYSHNGYPTDINTGIGQIFILQIWYMRTTIHILSSLLTSTLACVSSFGITNFIYNSCTLIFYWGNYDKLIKVINQGTEDEDN